MTTPVFADVEIGGGIIPQVWGKAELGGDRTEKREENRFWAPLGAGIMLGGSAGPIRLGGAISGSADLDYQYLNANRRRTTTAFYPGQAAVAAASRAHPRFDPDEDQRGRKKPAMDVVPDGILLSPDPRRWFSGWNLGVGRFLVSSDPEGLLHEAGGNGAMGQAVVIGRAFSARLTGFYAGIEGDRPLDHLASDDPVHYGVTIEGKWDFLHIGLLASHLRSVGRPAMSGYSVGPITVIPNQAAQSELRVDYALLRAALTLEDWYIRLIAGANQGQKFDPSLAGGALPTSRRAIRGGLGAASVEFRLPGGSRTVDACPGSFLPRNCILSHHFDSSLEISALHITRDNDDGDGRDTSFGPISSAPRLMGGMASVFLSGRAPQDDSLPLENPRIRTSVSAYTKDLSDRTDAPVVPGFQSGGMTIGGLRFGGQGGDGRADIFANYAALSKGRGAEVILVLSVPLWRSALETREGRLIFSWTEATYRSREWKTHEWTGLLERPRRTWYRRFLVGFAAAL